jgi:toxin ParE1/3/4
MKTWGRAQTERYSHGLRDCFHLLANNPSLGRSCDFIRPGLRRFEHGKHVVFYLWQPDEVLIARVLHQHMSPTKSQFER